MPVEKKRLTSQDYLYDFLRSIGKTKVSEFVDVNETLNVVAEKSQPFDIVVVCALAEERDSVFDAFDVPDEERKRTYHDFRSDFNIIYKKFTYADKTIALVTQNSMGMAAATSLATRSILAMKPKLIAMTGICAGRKDKVSLGDIIVADQVFDYTAGKKYIDKFSPRPRFISAEEDIRNLISTEILNNESIADSIVRNWRGSRITRRIVVYLKALASGTSVVDDEQTLMSAAALQDDLYAIDMEGYGIALAATALRTKWLVIKSAQDFADGQKDTDEGSYRKFSAYASAALLKHLIPMLFI